jgi:hypothetical protein
MQKVEGSSPFIRFKKRRKSGVFLEMTDHEALFPESNLLHASRRSGRDPLAWPAWTDRNPRGERASSAES